MASITLSTPATINVVATTSDHSSKSNLGTAQSGSYLTEATMLVYDEILRYQRDVAYTHGLTAEMVDDFNYNEFKGNVLWFMDELVGTESDWISDASNDETTAYGYVQFTEASVKTAVTRYEYHIRQFNLRRKKRDWEPYEYPYGKRMKTPKWLKTLKYSLQGTQVGTAYYPPTYDHKENLDALTYDQQLALAFVHLHSKESWDYNFVQLSKGDVAAAKTLYTNNHHMAIVTVTNFTETLTEKQKTSIYGAIKKIYEPMYGRGSSSTVLDDEPYFNLLKGYVGAYFYKDNDWFNTDDKVNFFEYSVLVLANAVYQIIDAIFTDETLSEAYDDYVEQGMGVYKAWQDSYGENAFIVRDELKGKIVELQLHDETPAADGSGTQLVNGPIVFVGFDNDGKLAVYEKTVGAATLARLDGFFDIHYGW